MHAVFIPEVGQVKYLKEILEVFFPIVEIKLPPVSVCGQALIYELPARDV